MSRSAPRVSFAPALLCGLAACLGALGFGGCTSGTAEFADPAAVQQAASLTGGPLPIEEWTTDLAAARARAAAENKDVLMLFTGSDWCPPCMQLEAEVFSRAPASRLEDDFVPVLFDFPNGKPQPPELVAANAAAQEAYGVEGYPTVLLTTPDGTRYGQVRYGGGGPAAFLADTKALRQRRGGAASESSVGGDQTASL